MRQVIRPRQWRLLLLSNSMATKWALPITCIRRLGQYLGETIALIGVENAFCYVNDFVIKILPECCCITVADNLGTTRPVARSMVLTSYFLFFRTYNRSHFIEFRFTYSAGNIGLGKTSSFLPDSFQNSSKGATPI